MHWMELMTGAVEKELPDDALLRGRVIEHFACGTGIERYLGLLWSHEAHEARSGIGTCLTSI